MGKSKYPRARVVQFCTNVFALDGTKILDEQQAKDICEKHIKSIDKFAIGLHNKDTHDENSIAERNGHKKLIFIELYQKYAGSHGVAQDENTETGYVQDTDSENYAKQWADFYYPDKNVGDAKELHVHVDLKFKNARGLDEIARWFGIPVNMIDIAKGHGAFEDIAEYLVHAKQPEKYQYDPKDIIANFDYPIWLDNQLVKDILHEKYHISNDDLNDIINEVAVNGMTLQKAEEMVSAPIFLRNKNLFKQARNKYIYDKMEMPPMRQVFYVDGDGAGAGKSILTKLFCKMLASRNYGADTSKDVGQLKEYIYKVGQKGVAWDKYDGQPIVFIDDRTAGDMLGEFNGHEGVKNLFDTFPEKETSNIKYGDVTIVASYIVINGIQPFNEFVNGLNGTYTTKAGVKIESDTDITQYTRRITGIFRVYSQKDLVQILFNKSQYRQTREYEAYELLTTRAVNYKNAIERLKGNALYRVGEVTLGDAYDASKEITDRLADKIDDPENVPDEFMDYGAEVFDPSLPTEIKF